MKKKLALLLASALVIGTLGACGNSSSTTSSGGGDSTPASEVAECSED